MTTLRAWHERRETSAYDWREGDRKGRSHRGEDAVVREAPDPNATPLELAGSLVERQTARATEHVVARSCADVRIVVMEL